MRDCSKLHMYKSTYAPIIRPLKIFSKKLAKNLDLWKKFSKY